MREMDILSQPVGNGVQFKPKISYNSPTTTDAANNQANASKSSTSTASRKSMSFIVERKLTLLIEL